MAHQMNYGKSGPYKVAKADGGPYVTTPGTNYDGGHMTKKDGGNGRSRQVNFDITENIPVKFEKGQGQKAGTGNNNGY